MAGWLSPWPRASPGSILETERLEPFLPIEADIAGSRLNDGRCDRQGRLWVGSMARGQAAHAGTVYRCTAQEAVPVLHDIRVPNCTAFSPDGRTMYFADTPTGLIRAFDLDPSTGAISNERRFAKLPENSGFPDGATVDAEGGLWVAHWGGGRVSRFAPDGTFDRSITVPAPRVTCCAFGGPRLETLFITTARVGMDDAALSAAPLVRRLVRRRAGRARCGGGALPLGLTGPRARRTLASEGHDGPGLH